MNSFRLLGFRRKLEVFSAVDGFFELHSRAMERKTDKDSAEKNDFQQI